LILLPIALFFLTAINPTWGQPRVIVGPGGRTVIDQSMSTVDLPTDRTMARGIDRAKDRIAEGEFSQAIRFLDEVLSGEQDSFIAVGEAGEHAGLKETASDMIRDLPPAGREMYESLFGPVARKKLNDALMTGNVIELRQVAQQYFYTPAGYEAAMMVAQHEADAGRHLSASLLYDQLLNTAAAAERLSPQLALLAARSRLALGETKKAGEVVASASEYDDTAQIAGRKEQLKSAADNPLNWFEKIVGLPRRTDTAPIDQWLMPRGNAARNGQSEGGLPHMRVRWEARLLSHPQYETVHNELWSSLEQRRQALPTAGTPLAIGDTIIATTAQNVVAVDFRTGKRIWQTQPQRISEFEQLLNAATDMNQFDATSPLVQAFARRLWDDYLYNSVSSDGQRVFVIRDLKLPEFTDPDPFGGMAFRGGEYGDQVVANRLCAYDLVSQGKLVWEIDGAASEGELAGAYFLGAPVIVDQKLYCLAEIKSAIHLAAIDRHTGQLDWLQQLAGLQNGIYLDPLRRLQAAMPSYDSGMLVCPTGAGVVIGINLEKLALAWAYQYDTTNNSINQFRREGGRIVEQHPTQWIESSAILADGKVLLAPPESNWLHCLDLVTGKVLWKRGRGDGIFVAGVEGDSVLIVGQQGLTALNLKTGKPIWKEETHALPTGSMPSGRGFFSEGKYFLPLNTAEVVALDMASGQIVERTQSRFGTVLGNLISHEGAILSQNGKFLDCFDQIDVLRDDTEMRLAKNPDDFEALRTLGELTYNEGRLAKSIELLEKAYELSSDDPRTREVLGDCLLEAIEQDFAAYHNRLPELREILADHPSKKLTLLRLEAQGMLQLNKPVEAFEVCLEIARTAGEAQEILEIAPDHQASAANWLRAQIAEIWREADSQTREKILEQLATLKAEMPAQAPGLTSFLAGLPGIDTTIDDEYAKIALELAKQNQLLGAQQLLLDYTSNEGPHQAEAVALCSRMLHERGFSRSAMSFDELLAGQFANVPCLDGKTGQQCLATWWPQAEINTLQWPYGKVEVDQPPQTNPTASSRARVPLAEIRLEHGDDVLNSSNIFFGIRLGELTIRDSYGREVFRKVLGEEEKQLFNTHGMYGVTRGNLLICSIGQQITAINTLAEKSDASAVLWRKSTVRPTGDRFRFQTQTVYGGERPGSYRPPRFRESDRFVGVLAPLTRDSCVYQDQRGLHCVDSMTGKLRWSRQGTPNACQLFGDEEVVIAVPESTGPAHVYSMLDGRSLGEVILPRWQEQLATQGLNLIAWTRSDKGEHVLSRRDALTGNVDWEKTFARGSHVDVARNRYIAVVEPTGRYHVIDAIDGQTLVEYKTDPIPSLGKIHLFAGTDHFMIATEVNLHTTADRTHMPFNPFDFVNFNGQLMAFAAEDGKPLWSRPAEVRQESLMLSQPVDSPVITFVSNHNRQDANGSRQLVDMLVLEKSTGRVLFSEEGLPQSPNHCVTVANPATDEVVIEMINRLVRLKFTDRPRAPEPPASYEAAPSDQEGPKGIFGILEKFSGVP
jgi:outer membrane protein assembly factor BamB